MKSIAGAGKKVMQTMNDSMACFNLLPRMIEHWHYVQELNKTLVDLVEFLALDYCTSSCRLNPKAASCMPTTIVPIDEDAELNENKGNDAQ